MYTSPKPLISATIWSRGLSTVVASDDAALRTASWAIGNGAMALVNSGDADGQLDVRTPADAHVPESPWLKTDISIGVNSGTRGYALGVDLPADGPAVVVAFAPGAPDEPVLVIGTEEPVFVAPGAGTDAAMLTGWSDQPVGSMAAGMQLACGPDELGATAPRTRCDPVVLLPSRPHQQAPSTELDDPADQAAVVRVTGVQESGPACSVPGTGRCNPPALSANPDYRVSSPWFTANALQPVNGAARSSLQVSHALELCGVLFVGPAAVSPPASMYPPRACSATVVLCDSCAVPPPRCTTQRWRQAVAATHARRFAHVLTLRSGCN